MQAIQLEWGKITFDEVDLTVLPASGKLKAREADETQRNIEYLQIPSPAELESDSFVKNEIGQISKLVVPANKDAKAKFVVYATTSNKGSTVEAIREIGRKLGAITANNTNIRIIEAPFLGCGSGRLEPGEALSALAEGFLEKRHQNAILKLRNNVDLTYKIAEVALRALQAKHFVILIHGIRTHGVWQEVVGNRLSEEAIEFLPVKYGFFSAIATILPWPFRRIPVNRLVREYADLKAANPNCRISVIAHSFGTYATFEALRRNRGMVFERVILVGSVLSGRTRMADFSRQIRRMPVLNDCGWSDFVPALAAGATWGLGSTGRFGFGTFGVQDRFHQAGHSDALTKEFAEKYWVPFLKYGTIETEGTLQNRKKVGYFTSLVSIPLSIPAALVFVMVVVWMAIGGV